ncbi:MAG: hypothetical protein LBF09_00720 [Odoribacteraceae bacterium]|jgi:hypothetical protein|nr:hypothetical protein [Odoribacteraceae bacterium]
MKQAIYFTALLLFPWACVPDNGNYTYVDPGTLLPPTVTGIDAEYTLHMMDTLRVTPLVAEGAGEENDYLWYVYSTTMQRDTIGHSRELVFPVTLLPALNYRVTFQITNRESGLYRYYYTTLKVTTPFAEGWYVTKDQNNVTDLDFIFPDGKLAANILSAANGEGVPGEAVTSANAKNITVIVPLDDGRDSTFKDHDCIYVATRSTVQLYDLESMALMNKIENLFMLLPDKVAPADVICTAEAKVITNDSVSYCLDTRASAANIGKWGIVTPGSRIDPVNMCRSVVGGFLVFDPDTRSLKQLNSWKKAYSAVQAIGGTVPTTNMNFDMVFMKEKATMMAGGVALMKKRGTDELQGFTISGLLAGGLWENPTSPIIMNPFATSVTVPAGSRLHDATLYGTHGSMDVLYFSRGDNELWYYHLVNGIEENVLTLPAGESVVYAQTVVRYISGATYTNLAVLTSGGGRWTLRVYDFQPSSPLVAAEPLLVSSGEGNPRNVFYRSLTSTTSF